MLGSAVSSSTPKDFHPNSHIGQRGSRPLMNSPCLHAGPDPWVPVHRGGNAEGAGLADRLAQEVDQCALDARVLDASGREKKLHAASWSRCCRARTFWALTDPYGGRDWQATENSSALGQIQPHFFRGHVRNGQYGFAPCASIVARCEVRYSGRLRAFLPESTRLLILKDDASVLVHAGRRRVTSR